MADGPGGSGRCSYKDGGLDRDRGEDGATGDRGQRGAPRTVSGHESWTLPQSLRRGEVLLTPGAGALSSRRWEMPSRCLRPQGTDLARKAPAPDPWCPFVEVRPC